MPSSSPPPSPPSAPLPGRELPRPDLGPLRYSRRATETVDGAIKGAYVMGAADGFAAGQTVGYAEGRVAAYVEASGLTAVVFGLILFVVCTVLRVIRR